LRWDHFNLFDGHNMNAFAQCAANRIEQKLPCLGNTSTDDDAARTERNTDIRCCDANIIYGFFINTFGDFISGLRSLGDELGCDAI